MQCMQTALMSTLRVRLKKPPHVGERNILSVTASSRVANVTTGNTKDFINYSYCKHLVIGNFWQLGAQCTWTIIKRCVKHRKIGVLG